jgi:hypothetical protein
MVGEENQNILRSTTQIPNLCIMHALRKQNILLGPEKYILNLLPAFRVALKKRQAQNSPLKTLY